MAAWSCWAAHRDLIVIQAGKHNLPSVFPYRYFANAGGLVSYGPDTINQYRVAADYIDRILKGEKPAELPVQFPTKYNLVINLKTAKALGLTIPQSLLATADEVIEWTFGNPKLGGREVSLWVIREISGAGSDFAALR
jgi:putative ABC transport system substrate-binding protein